MSVRLKLFFGFAILIAFSALQGGWAIKESKGLGQLVADTYDKSLMTINFARSAKANFLIAEGMIHKASGDSASGLGGIDIEEFTDITDEVVGDLEVAQERVGTERSTALIDKLMALTTAWQEKAIAGFEKLAEADGAAQDAEQLQTALNEEAEAIREELILLIEYASEDGYLFRQKAMSDVEAAVLHNIIATGAVVAVGIILAIALGFMIARPLGKMRKVMTALADGDMEVEIKPTRRRDEIGAMTKAIIFFKDSLSQAEDLRQEQKRAREEKQKQDEAAAAERKREVLAMADSFEKNVLTVVESLTGSTGHLNDLATSMSDAANQTNQRSAAVAATTDETSTNMQTVASATEQLSSSVGTVGKHVGESSKIAEVAVAEASATNNKIKKLAEAVNKIGEVIDLITDIAAQTNLLALNATIESARAGDAGRGFAVVAKEVKSLATQTAKATEEISSQISQIQGETDDAVSAIGRISDVIGRISETSTEISTAVDEQGSATREIASIVQQATAGTNEITGNIAQVNEAAGETGQAASQVLDAADTLSQQGKALRQQVDNFLESIRAA